MITNSAIIYDCEIIKCIPDRGRPNDPRLDYCAGWDDHQNMGISCIGVFDYQSDQLLVFTGETLADFAALVKEREHVIGFNSRFFDDLLCRANGIEVTTTYDILVEVRRATGQPDRYVRGLTRAGYNLDNLVWRNLGASKTGSGELAPRLWQQGKHQEVIDYCKHDVMLTKRLLETWGNLIDPTDESRFALRCPPLWTQWEGAPL